MYMGRVLCNFIPAMSTSLQEYFAAQMLSLSIRFDPNKDVTSKIAPIVKGFNPRLLDYLITYLYSNSWFRIYTPNKPLVPDPYVRVTFNYQSQATEILTQTLSPIWNQTLIFKEVDIFDNPKDLEKNPPSVVMEVFDYDKVRRFVLRK